MLIGAHQGLIGGQMITPVDASYLADAVILMRYFETKGEVRQAISVVKKRGGAHERTIREFRLAGGRHQRGRAVAGIPRRAHRRAHLRRGQAIAYRRRKTLVTEADRDSLEQRVLVLAPTGKDAALTRSLLERAGIASHCCPRSGRTVRGSGRGRRRPCCCRKKRSLPEQAACLAEWLRPTAALVRLARADPRAARRRLRRRRPGDGPARQRHGARTADARRGLVSAVRTALRARQRQYQIRDHSRNASAAFRRKALLAAIVASSDDAIISKTLDGNILTGTPAPSGSSGTRPRKHWPADHLADPAGALGEEPRC